MKQGDSNVRDCCVKNGRTLAATLLLAYLVGLAWWWRCDATPVHIVSRTDGYLSRPSVKWSPSLSSLRKELDAHQRATTVRSAVTTVQATKPNTSSPKASTLTATIVTSDTATSATSTSVTLTSVPTTSVPATSTSITTAKSDPATSPTSSSASSPPPKPTAGAATKKGMPASKQTTTGLADGGPNAGIFTKLLEKHRKLQDAVLAGKAPLSRAIIVRCKRQDVCAGLGDRVYGILVLFLSAILTDRAFFIVNDKPKPMANYVEPNTLDWRVSSIQDAAVRKKVKRCLDGNNEFDNCGFHNILMPGGQCPSIMGEVFNPRNFVIILSDHRTECVQRMLVKQGVVPPKGENGFTGTNPDHQMWAANVSHIMFHALFKFKENVLTKAIKALTLPKTKTLVPPECLVCVHVRSGSGVHERARHTDWTDFARCGKTAQADLESAKACSTRPTWLIVGDNANAPLEITNHIDLKTVNTVISTTSLGAPTHVDQNNGASEDMMVHVFVDWYLLTRCKYFVASLSTFSGTASIAGGATVHRYDMETSGHAGGCKRHTIADWQRDANI